MVVVVLLLLSASVRKRDFDEKLRHWLIVEFIEWWSYWYWWSWYGPCFRPFFYMYMIRLDSLWTVSRVKRFFFSLSCISHGSINSYYQVLMNVWVCRILHAWQFTNIHETRFVVSHLHLHLLIHFNLSSSTPKRERPNAHMTTITTK